MTQGAGLELGADDFIRKPFTRGEVMARIRAALRRSATAQKKSLISFQMHDLEVWPDELRATRDGQPIDLTPREAAILGLLHQEKGSPVHRDTFLDRCWGQDYFPDSRTLDQHIVTLRKKVEADPANPLIIEAVRGIGYQFRHPSADRGRLKTQDLSSRPTDRHARSPVVPTRSLPKRPTIPSPLRLPYIPRGRSPRLCSAATVLAP